MKPHFTKVYKLKMPNKTTLKVKSGTQIIDRFWGHLRAYVKYTQRTPGNVILRRKIRAAQFTYWTKGQNAWKAAGNMLQYLFEMFQSAGVRPESFEAVLCSEKSITESYRVDRFVWIVVCSTGYLGCWRGRLPQTRLMLMMLVSGGAGCLRSSICGPFGGLQKQNPPQNQTPILELKGGVCFGGFSKKRLCLTHEFSLGPKTKKPKSHGECWNSFVFLVFWFFWFFGSLVFWFSQCNSLYHMTKKPKNQRTKKPKNQRTKKTKKQKTKTVPAFSVELWFLGFLVSVVGWFFTDTFGGLKLDTPEKARTRRWERCFEGHGLSWGGGGDHICACMYVDTKNTSERVLKVSDLGCRL